MISTTLQRSKYDLCNEVAICTYQERYRWSHMGKWKIKYQASVSYCYFCGSDLKTRMYMEGIKIK